MPSQTSHLCWEPIVESVQQSSHLPRQHRTYPRGSSSETTSSALPPTTVDTPRTKTGRGVKSSDSHGRSSAVILQSAMSFASRSGRSHAQGGKTAADPGGLLTAKIDNGEKLLEAESEGYLPHLLTRAEAEIVQYGMAGDRHDTTDHCRSRTEDGRQRSPDDQGDLRRTRIFLSCGRNQNGGRAQLRLAIPRRLPCERYR